MAEHQDQPPAEPFSLKAFLIELAIYTVLVVAYFLLVLHFLGGWLKGLFDHERWTYAIVGLAVVVTQAALLELLTSGLLRFFRARTK